MDCFCLHLNISGNPSTNIILDSIYLIHMDILYTEQSESNETDCEKIKKNKKDSDAANHEVLKQLRLRRICKYINACIISAGIALGSYFFAHKILDVNKFKAEVMHDISALEQKIDGIQYKRVKKIVDPMQILTQSENTRETIDMLFRSYYFPVRCGTLSNIVKQYSENMGHWMHIQRYVNQYSSVAQRGNGYKRQNIIGQQK